MIACLNAREGLTEDPRRRIEFYWCPSHEGIASNDLVDEDVKRGAHLSMERDKYSLAHARHLLAVHLEADWREEYRHSPSYHGQQFLRLSVFESPSHISCAPIKPYNTESPEPR